MSDKSLEEENSQEMESEEEDTNKNNKKFNFKPIKERQTSRFLTKFEKAKVLGERAIQISNGAKVGYGSCDMQRFLYRYILNDVIQGKNGKKMDEKNLEIFKKNLVKYMDDIMVRISYILNRKVSQEYKLEQQQKESDSDKNEKNKNDLNNISDENGNTNKNAPNKKRTKSFKNFVGVKRKGNSMKPILHKHNVNQEEKLSY